MSSPTRHAARRLTIGLGLGFAAVFAWLVVSYAHARWIPASDDALTLLRVRSVWSAHPPLVGLPGRIGTYPHFGSHPGPLSFYALWPVYVLLGSTPWSLMASTAFVQLAAVVTTLVLVARRGRPLLVAATAVVLAALVAFFGPVVMLQPWNPYLPTLWWVAFAVAVWAAMCGDAPAVPVAVVAGSFCLATHISYAGLVPGLALVGAVVLALRVRRGDVPWTRAHSVSLLVAVACAVVLWVPPIVDQLVHSPGNLGVVFSYFSNPPKPAIGFTDGGRLLLSHLNPWNLVARRNEVFGPLVPGTLMLAAWLASVVVAVRKRLTDLLLLDVVVAATLGFGLVSMARIFDGVAFYLVLWSYGALGLACLAVAWTVAVALADRARIVAVVGAGCLVGLVAWSGVGFVRDARTHPLPFGDADQATLRRIVPATLRALDARPKDDERYFLDWVDPYRLGNVEFGLYSEIARAGHDVIVPRDQRRFFTAEQVGERSDADVRIHLAVGDDVEVWRARDDAVEVVTFDPRSYPQYARFVAAERRGLEALRAAGLERYEEEFTDRTVTAKSDPRLPAEVREAARVMSLLGSRTSVFVEPLRSSSG